MHFLFELVWKVFAAQKLVKPLQMKLRIVVWLSDIVTQEKEEDYFLMFFFINRNFELKLKTKLFEIPTLANLSKQKVLINFSSENVF